MTGQAATDVAKGFDERLDVTGVILTKLDGDTRGGAALSIRAVTGKPILFTGQGEKLTDLDVFHPDRMASRILGMGDMLSLIEKAQQDYDAKEAKRLLKRCVKTHLISTTLLINYSRFKNGPIRSDNEDDSGNGQ